MSERMTDDMNPLDIANWDLCDVHETTFMRHTYCKDCRIAELEANYLNLEDNYLAALNSNRVLRPRNAELEAEIAECKRQFAAYILQQGEDDE